MIRADRWDPNAIVSIIEQIAILGAAFSLFSQCGLEVLFSLDEFPYSVHRISSYGGAALLHGGFILVHTVQAMVMKWHVVLPILKRNVLLARGILAGDLLLFQRNDKSTAAYLRDRGWEPGAEVVRLDENVKDAIQQSREVLRVSSTPDPLHNFDINKTQVLSKDQLNHIADVKAGIGHHHNHGFAAILADIIAHSVSVPTFSIAWLLQAVGVPVSAIAVAWTVEISAFILLGCLIYTSTVGSMNKWGKIGHRSIQGDEVRIALRKNIAIEFLPKYSAWIHRVDFSVHRLAVAFGSILNVSFDVSVYASRWKDFSESETAEQDLRRLAYEVKAFDFSRLNRGLKDQGRDKRMIRWLISDETPFVERLHLDDIPALNVFGQELGEWPVGF